MLLAMLLAFFGCTPNVPSIQKSMLQGGASEGLNNNGANPIINDLANNTPSHSVSVPLVSHQVSRNMDEAVNDGELIKVQIQTNLDQFRVTGNTHVPEQNSNLVPIAASLVLLNNEAFAGGQEGSPSETNNCELKMSFQAMTNNSGNSKFADSENFGTGGLDAQMSNVNSVRYSWTASLTDTSSCQNRLELLKNAKSLILYFKPKDSSITVN